MSLRPQPRRVVTFCVCRYWVVARLVAGRVRAHSCVRETCVRRLQAAWGMTVSRSSLPFARECRLGVWFGFVWACTASCGWNVRCVGVRGDAWSVMLSPCNKRVKGRSHTAEEQKAIHPQNPMQPASHRDSHTRPDSAQTPYTTSIAAKSAPYTRLITTRISRISSLMDT